MRFLKKKMSKKFINILTKKYKYSILFLKWLFSRKFLKWLLLNFLDFLYGNGEKPFNVIRFSVIIILLFAIIFSIFSITTSPENIQVDIDLSEIISGRTSKIFLDLKSMNTKINSFGTCLYFSIVTFTTLGYGDFKPIENWSQLIAGLEAFIGLFMMALLSYTFGAWSRRR